MTVALFIVATLSVALFGLPAAFHPLIRRGGLAARCGAAYLFGALVLTVWGTTLSVAGIRWSITSISVPLVVLAGGSTLVIRRRVESGTDPSQHDGYDSWVGFAWAIAASALLYLAWRFTGTYCTSADLLFFWGTKATRFAANGGFDSSLLSWPYFVHAHINYPPMHTMQLAWAAIVARTMAWTAAPGLSFVWIASTVFVLEALLRPRMGRRESTSLAALWSVVMAASMVASRSGGNAEPALVAYLTIACAALLVWTPSAGMGWTAFTGAALAGAALTKNEGLVAAALLVAGAAARDLLMRHRGWWKRTCVLSAIPIGAVGLWYLFLWLHELPMSDPIRERAGSLHLEHLATIMAATPAGLAAGTLTGSWWLCVAALIVARRSPVPALPAVALCVGVLGFSFAYYLHVAQNPTLLIGWTLPRLCQPALSGLVLWSGWAWFASPTDGVPKSVTKEN